MNFPRLAAAILLGAALPISAIRAEKPEAIGVVLGGGGAFGAWQVGAMEAFFENWKTRRGEEPPIRVIAGTSTGALIAPFVFSGSAGIREAARWYTEVKQSDIIAPRVSLLLPFPLFALTQNSFFTAGYGRNRLLDRAVRQSINADNLGHIAEAWPWQRIGAATTDFVSGTPRLFTNRPDEVAVLRDAIFASAMAPLGMPPVRLKDRSDALLWDGGTYANIPIRELFDLAATKPAVALTHVVVVTPLAAFPGNENDPIQTRRFPQNPKFRDVNERAVQLYSESSATKDIALLRSALAMRNAGLSRAKIKAITGIGLPPVTPRLTVLQPRGRLGWRSLEFRRADMRAMYERGRTETRAQLAAD